MSSTRHCPECGAENPLDHHFCGNCGSNLEVPTSAATGVSAEAEPDAPEKPTSPPERTPPSLVSDKPPWGAQEKRRAVLAVAIGVLAIAAVATTIALTEGTTEPAEESDEAAVTQTETTQTDPEDTDGDGIADEYDADPYDANVGVDEDDVDSAPSDEDTDSGEEVDGGATPTKTVEVPGVASDDDVTFRVESLEAVSSIPTDEFTEEPITPSEGAKLVKAVVTWKNNMSTSASIFCGGDSAKLLDQEDRNFDPLEDQIDIEGSAICDDVQPGFKQTVILAFEMPADSKTQGIALWNGESEDDFSGDTYAFFVK